MKSGPTASRTRRTISTASRMRPAKVAAPCVRRVLVAATRNWLSGSPRCPSPRRVVAGFGAPAPRRRTKARICPLDTAALSACGVNGEIGERMRRRRDRRTVGSRSGGVQDLQRDLPPSACTASVTCRWRRAAPWSRAGGERLGPAATLGAKPPVTISPTPPARTFGVEGGERLDVARPVFEVRCACCPISTRLGRRGEAEVQRLEQVREGGQCGSSGQKVAGC
jgi:hypothetical protein